MIKIANVCCLVTLNQKLPSLKYLCDRLKNARYANSRKFMSLVVKGPRETFLIYKSGKIVSLGGQSMAGSRKAAEHLVREINKTCNLNLYLKDFILTNMVGYSALGYKIRLHKIYEAYMAPNVFWEPELFPGLQWRFNDLGVTLLAFASGKLIVTGAKTQEQIEEAVQLFHGKASEHKCVYQ